MPEQTEKTTGTSLTPVAEYTETARALAELQGRFKNLIVDVSTPKGLKIAKADVAELRTLRTSLEKRRKELKAPILERGKLLDEEARRITGEILALEEPLKLQVDAKEAELEAARLAKLEAERLRVEAIQQKIQAIRDVPGSLVGKPSVIIAGQLAKLQATVLDEADLAEYYVTATDALTAAVARVQDLLAAQHEAEAEQKRIAAERAELDRMRAENERLQREAEERRLADERKAAAERAEADRLAQAERDRLAAEQCAREEAERAERERQERLAQQAREEVERVRREEEAQARAEQEAALQAERERQAAEQRKLDEQAAQLRRAQQAAAKKAEADRLANLGLREAAEAVVDYFQHHQVGEIPQVVDDLAAALANDAAPAKPARVKKVAAA